nr:hypothetical protein Itr_chr02CG17210 [Ipomoea trifida]GLL32312.1 hypothetical protein Itr_chr07CG19320 [Ipomoea trifida]GLL45392.1 hypothetical protein Itr_chr13CG21710 [Ipomoea trifida]GLL49510.1 hypothetical protein Itr_chr15CG10800 [Ipomoea trifida]GMD03475.1 hypothetical protein Iba_chr06aCG9230 [Ipomoea batatas]
MMRSAIGNDDRRSYAWWRRRCRRPPTLLDVIDDRRRWFVHGSGVLPSPTDYGGGRRKIGGGSCR